MVNSVDFALGPLPYLSGRGIEEFIKEHVFAIHVVNKKISVKYAH
jgi:hypothetical protein